MYRSIDRLPTISGIQKATTLVTLFAVSILLAKASPGAAAACALGSALMMVNLSLLSWTVRVVFAVAKKAGGVNTLGLLVAPLKMLCLVGIVYLVISSGRVNLRGFIIGTLTQIAAIFIEVGRSCCGRLSSPQPDQ
jgi:hypothetical protein